MTRTIELNLKFYVYIYYARTKPRLVYELNKIAKEYEQISSKQKNSDQFHHSLRLGTTMVENGSGEIDKDSGSGGNEQLRSF